MLDENDAKFERKSPGKLIFFFITSTFMKKDEKNLHVHS